MEFDLIGGWTISQRASENWQIWIECRVFPVVGGTFDVDENTCFWPHHLIDGLWLYSGNCDRFLGTREHIWIGARENTPQLGHERMLLFHLLSSVFMVLTPLRRLILGSCSFPRRPWLTSTGYTVWHVCRVIVHELGRSTIPGGRTKSNGWRRAEQGQ